MRCLLLYFLLCTKLYLMQKMSSYMTMNMVFKEILWSIERTNQTNSSGTSILS